MASNQAVGTLSASIELVNKQYLAAINQVIAGHSKYNQAAQQTSNVTNKGRMTNKRMNGVMLESGRVLEDLASTWGNLGMMVRAAGNNVVQAASAFGGWYALAASIGFVLATMAVNYFTASKATKDLASSTSNLKDKLEELAQQRRRDDISKERFSSKPEARSRIVKLEKTVKKEQDLFDKRKTLVRKAMIQQNRLAAAEAITSMWAKGDRLFEFGDARDFMDMEQAEQAAKEAEKALQKIIAELGGKIKEMTDKGEREKFLWIETVAVGELGDKIKNDLIPELEQARKEWNRLSEVEKKARKQRFVLERRKGPLENQLAAANRKLTESSEFRGTFGTLAQAGSMDVAALERAQIKAQEDAKREAAIEVARKQRDTIAAELAAVKQGIANQTKVIEGIVE